MPSSIDYTVEFLNNAHVYLFRYLGLVLYFSGMIGNFLTIGVFVQRSWRKNVCVFYFLLILSSNMILINCIILGGTLIYLFNIYPQNTNNVICKLYMYLSYFSLPYFPTILVLASVDRLLISSQDVDTRLYSSKRLAYFSISISTIIWCIFSSHVLIKVSLQEIAPTIFICDYDRSLSYRAFYNYSGLVVVIGLFLLLSILSVLTLKNVRRNRTVPHQKRQQIRTMHKKDFQLLRCLYAHNISYIICSTLAVISAIYNSVIHYRIPTSFEQALNIFLVGIGTFSYSIPYCISFFIFLLGSKAFRQELKRFFYRLAGNDIQGTRGEEVAENNIPTSNPIINTIVISH